MIWNIREHKLRDQRLFVFPREVYTITYSKNYTSLGWKCSEFQLIQAPSHHGGKTKRSW